MLDSFYTPKDAAEKLITRLGISPRKVADFCVGGGELLRACEAQFPDVKCVAVDKSIRAVRSIVAGHKSWQVHCADFLNERQMTATGLRMATFDLVVLNPPFSCRGTRYPIAIDNLDFSGSKAMLFLSRALLYVRPGGVLRAILPIGAVCAERDAVLVRYLRKKYGFREYWRSSDISFCGKTPNVVFVELRKPRNVASVKIVEQSKFTAPTYLHRGCFNVVEAQRVRQDQVAPGLVRYVHTTDLQKGVVCDSDFWVPAAGRRIVRGPCVLIPRVGTPSLNKVSVVSTKCCYVLSDCVIALQCKSLGGAARLKRLIKLKWMNYQKIYAGTGARYTTLRRIDEFLRRNKWNEWSVS